jgi:acyl-CoA thioesterase-1
MRNARSQPCSYGRKTALVQRRTVLALLTFICLVGPGKAGRAADDPPVKIVALGDSLTAGFGLPQQASFPVRLGQALAAKGIKAEIVNAGVSGDTASGGLDRLDWSVPEGTEAVILELGANDALRGVDPAVTRKALDAILSRLKARKIAVLLCGMLAPPNMGAEYANAFNRIFPELASTHGVVFYPFFLDGVAADESLNQRDGLHPTAAGVDVIVQRILPKVEELIERARAARGS